MPDPKPADKPAAGPSCPTNARSAASRLMPLGRSPAGVDDVQFLAAEDDEVKVRLRIEADGSLTIVALAPNTRFADGLLDNVPQDRVRTELCG